MDEELLAPIFGQMWESLRNVLPQRSERRTMNEELPDDHRYLYKCGNFDSLFV
jgi:hypothetical protein